VSLPSSRQRFLADVNLDTYPLPLRCASVDAYAGTGFLVATPLCVSAALRNIWGTVHKLFQY